MYILSITRIKYPKNETNIYEYENFEHLTIGLKFMLENEYITKNDIVRIEVKENED